MMTIFERVMSVGIASTTLNGIIQATNASFHGRNPTAVLNARLNAAKFRITDVP